ncbi:MAG: uroporphyrinogen-III synthase [Flavisolibacter sp.]
MAKHKVLSTKKLEPSLVEKAEQSGIEITEQEFISVQPVVSKEKEEEISGSLVNTDAVLIFTSSNAVSAIKEHFHTISERQFYCIGGKTKKALLNFVAEEKIVGTADYGKELAQKIVAEDVKEAVFFCGNRRRDELPEMLQHAGIRVKEVVVYETVETPHTVTEDFEGVLFFSPSAVQSFFSANQLNKDTVCFAIGETTAESIAHFSKNRIVVSASPTQEKIVDAVVQHFENSTSQK